MGGVIFGWASISNTMLVSSDGAPGLSASTIHGMFVMGSSANMCSPFFLGVVLDRWGPRACSIASIAFSAAGFYLFGMAKGLAEGSSSRFLPSTESLFTLAVVLIGFGGPGVQNAIIHLANLFPANKGLVTALITGCFQLSFCIFFIFDQLWFFGGVHYEHMFVVFAGLCGLCLVASVLLWPDEPFTFDAEVRKASPLTRKKLSTEAHAYAAVDKTPPAFARAGMPKDMRPADLDGAEGSGGAPHGGTDRRFELGLIRFPSTFQKASRPASPAPPSTCMVLLHGGGGLAGGVDHCGAGGMGSISGRTAEPEDEALEPSKAAGLVGEAAVRLKAMPLGKQLRSYEFGSATCLLAVASFWANFYIGAVRRGF